MEKQNVFIAVGGSGTKVAEALIRLLAIGFPTRYEGVVGNAIPTSAGETLQIWRVDPDSNAGAFHELRKWVGKYRDLQARLEGYWGMEVAPPPQDVIDLDPLVLQKRGGEGDNIVKSLKGVLDSPIAGKQSSRPFLDLFFEEKDLDIQVDRGFYQKPFIGSAVMALFAESLLVPSSSAGIKCDFKALEDKNVRFFLCGSLHGGTGAAGVPVLGKFLKRRKDEKKGGGIWTIGACLLGPYHRPPDVPFSIQKKTGRVEGEDIKTLVEANKAHSAFKTLSDEGQEELARQILLGFYAEPGAMPRRASHSLSYYESSLVERFDELFLVSKPEPDTYVSAPGEKWSNGGLSQNNPLNSAEVVGAIAALNFFAESSTRDETYTVASSTKTLDSHRVKLHDLPLYTIGNKVKIDAERAFLASAITRHLIIHQLPWNHPGSGWPSDYALTKVYEKDEEKKIRDKDEFDQASALIIEFMKSTVDPEVTLGWSPDIAARLYELLAADQKGVERVQERLKKPRLRDKWKKRDPNLLGASKLILAESEFAKWHRDGTFNRGDYWRLVWANVYKKIEQAENAQAAGAAN
jgi:hypothetical protein